MTGLGLRRGVRAVALFEAAKGTLVFLAGCGALSLLHRDAQAVALDLVGRLHLHPSRKVSEVFLKAAANVTDTHLWFLAGLALVYSIFRYVEAYGLWKERTWAEWLAVVSGGMYVPLEIFELFKKPTWLRAGMLFANLLVVAFLALVLVRTLRRRAENHAKLKQRLEEG